MRQGRIHLSMIAALIAILVAIAPGHGGPGRQGSAAAHLASLRTGRWIQLEGRLQGGSTVTCTELGQLTGDFLDDDWSLRGVVRELDPNRQEFSIAGCKIRVSDKTIFDNPKGTFRGFADLREGKLVEVDGSFLQSRILAADEVDDESDELAHEPRLKTQVMVVGKIEHIDTRRRVVRVMGIEFNLTDKTRLRSVIE